MKLLGLGTLGLSLALLAGCAAPESSVSNSKGTSETTAATPALEPIKKTEAPAAFRADFRTEPGEVKAGEPATLSFTVKNNQGATVDNLQVVHEKPMHLLVVLNDLSEFYHIHPEPQTDGSFKVTHTFPHGGAYKLYADFTPPNATQVVDRLDVNVAGEARPRLALAEDKSNVKTVDSLRVTMQPDKPLRAGEELMLNFAVADAKTGKPATDLQPYLGALAHFVIISEDTVDFLHAHPMTKDEMAEMGGGSHGGMTDMAHDDAEAKPHSHDAAELKDKAQSDVSPSEVAAHTTFPRAGLYKVWAQFQRNNRVITVPFVVRVGGGEAVASNEGRNAQVPADAIKVTVSGAGYEPSRIEVKKGQPVKLAFYRKDAENCGGEVVFPKLNVRKKLPVGQTVVVEVTPQESGELTFACGMNMMKGALVVQ